jgi:hypothetical protein
MPPLFFSGCKFFCGSTLCYQAQLCTALAHILYAIVPVTTDDVPTESGMLLTSMEFAEPELDCITTQARRENTWVLQVKGNIGHCFQIVPNVAAFGESLRWRRYCSWDRSWPKKPVPGRRNTRRIHMGIRSNVRPATRPLPAEAICDLTGDVSQLCRSCHDGRLAGAEGHPADLAPSPTIAKRIPSDLPLEKGLLTCLSCHDVASRCKAGQTAALPNRNFLRGTQAGTPLSFCFRCHIQEKYRPFNAHDQLEAGKVKTDICVWCHLSAPDVRSPPREDASYALRSKSHAVCSNCHPVGKGHPTSGSHMYSTPSSEMMWYMSAYEMQFQMRLPFEQLLKYVRAAKRAPRTIPLDENGGITCYSCHNPHEKELLPSWNPRSVGAESKHALSGRLRARGGNVCIVCHKE